MAILEALTFNDGVIFGDHAIPDQSIYAASETQQYEVGTKLVYGDGREFRYTRAGGAIGAAKMTQQAAVDTKLTEIAQTGNAQSVGDVDITVLITTGATLVDDELAGGVLFVNQGTALGDIYKIVASELQSTDTLLNLKLETPIRNAIVVTDEISIIPNRQSNVIMYPTTGTGAAAGAALVQIADNEYFWAQTVGVAPIIVDTAETVVIGDSVGSPAAAAVAGACGVRATLEGIWGNVMAVGAAAEPALINVKLT
jgi:hypothetical protein